MCLGFPGRIESLDMHLAVVDAGGVKREISTIMLGDDVQIGDWVMVHAGFAMSKMDEKEAQDTLQFMIDVTKEDSEITDNL